MEKILEKFSNPAWSMKVILLSVMTLALHIKYLSSYMGR